MAAQNRMQSYESEGGGQGYMDSARHSMEECAESVKSAYDESPVAFCLTAFGIGLGVGAAIGMSLASRRTLDQRAATIGQRVLDAISDYVPNSLHDYVPKSMR